ncbi:MAG TPA: hypothetical protein VFJ57_00575 [Solirubrobacterales bacterium]|nr:hypothetical protein [Solirubrobacterales bacterium]
MKVLLITGAGASRNLGADAQMPLMPDWSDALCDALDAREPKLAQACHLTPGLQGPEFEKNLGLLLRWEQVRPLELRFQDLGGHQAGSHIEAVEVARRATDQRMAVIMETINVTLYEQFGQLRIDDDKASAAYQALLQQLGEPEIALATTNYDRSGETALETLGFEVDTGFRWRPNRLEVLEPTGLGSGPKTPAIHLHGAVGWYERNGQVGNHPADLPFNPTLGTPVVLYPDPEKDPTSDAVVNQLWIEFDAALDAADSVLVIGHSLHDPALVRALRRAAPAKPVVVTCHDRNRFQDVESKIPGAIATEMNFGPSLEAEPHLRKMVEKGSRPAFISMS